MKLKKTGKVKRPTDKERLDWLQKNLISAARLSDGWFIVFNELKSAGYGNTMRQAIDAAMKLQRKAGK